MSITHIRQELSELEVSLRKEIDTLPQFIDVLGAQNPHLSLGEMIDRLASSHLTEHPLFLRLNRLDAALCQLDLGLYGLC
ncbi:TraR/DksA family transcriptional regulator, partial [Shewanella sp. C31]|nr:TraR/DksA family transcriptional regulator [Shewanella electrica]